MIGHRIFVEGLPRFTDVNRITCGSHLTYLHCQSCDGRDFYKLESMHGIINEFYEAVYICVNCCQFYTLDRKDTDEKNSVVIFDSWKPVILERVDEVNG